MTAIKDSKKQTDPVCGMTVDSNSKFKTKHQDQEYCFCSQQCLDDFKKNPDDFL